MSIRDLESQISDLEWAEARATGRVRELEAEVAKLQRQLNAALNLAKTATEIAKNRADGPQTKEKP